MNRSIFPSGMYSELLSSEREDELNPDQINTGC